MKTIAFATAGNTYGPAVLEVNAEGGLVVGERFPHYRGSPVAKVAAALLALFLAALPVLAQEPKPEPEKVPSIGAAYYVGRGGRGGIGIATDMFSWPSLLWKGHRWYISFLLGDGWGGTAASVDLGTREGPQGRATLTLGLAGITHDLEAGDWQPAVLLTVRMGAGK